MSEEEILDKINYMINNWHMPVVEINIKWVQGLLDLYNKKKETSHYIQSQLDIANAKLIKEKSKKEKIINRLKDDIKQFSNYEERKQMDSKQLFENDARWFYAKWILDLLEEDNK